jgi:hypothetical protein
MNRDDHILNRLLKAARPSRHETPESIPFALEARILARWRSSALEEDWPGMVGCFRRAVVCAVLVMVVSIGWSQFTNVREVPGALALSNLAQAVQIVP